MTAYAARVARDGDSHDRAALAAALVNTRPRSTNPPEKLEDGRAVATLLASHGVTVSPDEAEAALPTLRQLRDELLRAFSQPDMAALAAVLNPYLARAPGARLVAGADGWVLRAPAEDLPLTDRVALLAAGGLAELAAERGLDRLGFCAAEDCGCVYADASARGARRFCSRTCANRVNVRRHRSKR
jgi:predicted RNA-binding Zn ribbon-like protein